MRPVQALLLCAALLASAQAVAQVPVPDAPKTAEEILACQLRTRPLTSTVRHIRIQSVDRAGVEREQRARVYGGLSREGFRTVLVEFTMPPDIRGLSVLITEREGANHMFVSPAGLPDVRQIRGSAGNASLFGGDFSYEDVERLYGLGRPGQTRMLERETPAGAKAHWVLETTPASDSGSGYSRIVSFIDPETCVLSRAEMFESGSDPRKVLTSNPESVSREGNVWVAHDLVLRDLRDGSETRLFVDEIELDVANSGIPFSPEELEAYRRAATQTP